MPQLSEEREEEFSSPIVYLGAVFILGGYLVVYNF
jgi:hypothetical protein